MRRRLLRNSCWALMTAIAVVGALGGVAWAAFSANASASQSLATLQLGNPPSASASITGSTSTACTSITITWGAATSADTYRIEVRENGGPWSNLVLETGAVTSFVDTAVRTHAEVEYRIHARDADSDWEGSTPRQANLLTCGVAPVDDLAVTNPCSRTLLTWSAPTGATTYDVQRRVNGGGWTAVATNQATTGFTDTTVHAAGALVEYQVRPGVGTTVDGNWTAAASITNWQAFRILSIVAGNSGTLGTLNVGDTVVVTYSKPVLLSSVTVHSMRTVSGATGGLYLNTTTTSTNGSGRLTTASVFGTTGAYAGGFGWSAANTVYTWTSNVAGSTMTAAFNNNVYTVGTGTRCAADSTTLVNTSAPTSSGRW